MTPDRTPAFSIEPMTLDDWPAVRRIYTEGIATGDATLEREAPDWGHFDRSQVKQVALVGVYQECGGKKGSFLLIIDEGGKKVRFVNPAPGAAQFAAVGADKHDIVFTSCLECDGSGVLRWNAKRKTFAWVRRGGRS